MPSPHYQTNNKMFDSLLLADTRIILASSISYFSSEPLNSFVMAKLKIKMKGRYMGIRFILSTFLASGTDSVIFSIIAFYGTINYKNLIYLILTMWLIKVMIELIGLPFSIRISKKLKISEKMDIYDKRTKFNMVSLDTAYTEKDNAFTITGNTSK